MNALTGSQLFGRTYHLHYDRDLNLNELFLKNLQDVTIVDPLKKTAFIKKITYFLNNPDESMLNLSDLSLNELPHIFMHSCFKERLVKLNLSRNKLTALPKSIGELTALKVLDLSDNDLTKLPEFISELTELENLDLAGNDLTALPESISELTSLKILNLSYNDLNALPSLIGRFSQLENLDLSGNKLTVLAESIVRLTQLESLDLSSNKLTTLASFIGRLTQLKSLNLSGNELTALPESIGELIELKTIRLNHNKLTELPDSINRLTALETLHLGGNKLIVLPDSIDGLTALKSLDLGFNKLIALPESIGGLTALQGLSVTENELTTLPDSIGQLPALLMLSFNNNPNLAVLPNWIGRLAKLKKLTQASLNELSLKNLHQTAIDDYVMKDDFIERITYFLNDPDKSDLDLSQLYLNELPDIFMHSSFKERLVNLNLTENRLTTLPNSIGGLAALKTLNLNDNKLTMLPECISELTQLHSLDLWGNGLNALPESMNTLTSLERLNLGYNYLTALPESIGELTALHYLDLSENQLTILPESMDRLTIEPNNLNLSGNFIEARIKDQGEKDPIEILQNFCVELGLERIPQLNNVFNKDNKEEFTSLTLWMNRLSLTSDSKSSPENKKWFFQCILDYLNLAERDPDFRTTFFETIADASETCGDRVALSVIQLGIAQDLLKKNEIKDIYDFMKSCIYPMHILEECAIGKIVLWRNRDNRDDGDHLDEIEVYLGYPVMLKKQLNIPINIKDMLYFQSSALTEKDLSDACAIVVEQVNNPANFSNFLITQSKWIKALKKNYNKRYKELESTREEAGLVEDVDFMKIEEAFTQGLLNLTKEAIEAIKKNDVAQSELRINRKRKRSQSPNPQ
jgi:Leucine-rich repeat (LRR) protein